MSIKLKNHFFVFVMMVAFLLALPESFGESTESELFDKGNQEFFKGNYKQAIIFYDEVLKKLPDHITTLKMKGIAQSNIGNHQESLKQFFKVLQNKPDDVVALTGMGVGLGNLGEYKEANKYFEKALKLKPESKVIKNYMNFLERITSKYPYTPTQNPQNQEPVVIPHWLKTPAKWWSEASIEDQEFTNTLQFLIQTNTLQIPSIETKSKLEKIPIKIKENAGLWANSRIQDIDFAKDILFLVEKQIIQVPISKEQKEIQAKKDFELFEKYLINISKNIIDEKRYIEYPNPSTDVVKKFLRDYARWNFEEEASKASSEFPNPVFEVNEGKYFFHYKVFVNDQPSGLPLDHISTLNSSFEYWESQELVINDRKAYVDFEKVKDKKEANIWITWTIRNLGEGVLGHAHLGKGVVEVTLGDYNCDGSFQLYAIESVEKIMTHEIGHSIGLTHSSISNNIMFSSFSPNYAYCLLS